MGHELDWRVSGNPRTSTNWRLSQIYLKWDNLASIKKIKFSLKNRCTKSVNFDMLYSYMDETPLLWVAACWQWPGGPGPSQPVRLPSSLPKSRALVVKSAYVCHNRFYWTTIWRLFSYAVKAMLFFGLLCVVWREFSLAIVGESCNIHSQSIMVRDTKCEPIYIMLAHLSYVNILQYQTSRICCLFLFHKG